MKFVKLNGVWYKEPDKDNKLYNYSGGYNIYNPSTDVFEQIIECDSWHELYLATDFTIGNLKMCDAWLSPKGELFYCECHYTGAEEILEVVFGESDDRHILNADDRLKEKGFVKLTTSAMWRVRFNDFKNMDLTQPQINKIFNWCTEHGLPIPYFKGG